MPKRNTAVDILRVIGLILVICAHCSFPEWFIRFRDFDVVLLVFVSGISYNLSLSRHQSQGWTEYALRRFRRLVLPVWYFLIFFFVFFFLLGRRFTVSQMIQSFALLAGGILFVWVYRIMLTSSLLNPLTVKAAEGQSKISLILISVLVIAGSDMIYQFGFAHLGTAGKVLEYLITYTAGYGAVSFLGCEFPGMDRRQKTVMTAVFAVLFLLTGLILHFPDFYDWKYPPMMYYISYGLMCSGILYMVFEHVTAENRLIRWLSQNCMNIFIWHIFAYYLLEYISADLLENVFVSFPFFLGIGMIGAWLQEKAAFMLKGRK